MEFRRSNTGGGYCRVYAGGPQVRFHALIGVPCAVDSAVAAYQPGAEYRDDTESSYRRGTAGMSSGGGGNAAINGRERRQRPRKSWQGTRDAGRAVARDAGRRESWHGTRDAGSPGTGRGTRESWHGTREPCQRAGGAGDAGDAGGDVSDISDLSVLSGLERPRRAEMSVGAVMLTA
jgi:hypothetical protein